MPQKSQNPNEQTQQEKKLLNADNWYITSPQGFEINIPKFKQCKDKDYCQDFQKNTIFYKQPYKYNISVKMTRNSSKQREEGAHVVMMQLLYDNLEPVHLDKSPNTVRDAGNSSEVLTGSVAIFHDLVLQESKEAVFPGVAFHDVCSYKLGGRKFRLCLYVVELPPHLCIEDFENQMSFYDPRNSSSLSPGCVGKLVSPSFTIRAKKPSGRPKKSRKRKLSNTAVSNPAPFKKMRTHDKIELIVDQFKSFSADEQQNLIHSIISASSDQLKEMMKQECSLKQTQHSDSESSSSFFEEDASDSLVQSSDSNFAWNQYSLEVATTNIDDFFSNQIL